jgi:hypothetical protein
MASSAAFLSAAHWLSRAEEARDLAQACDDPALRAVLHEIAQQYRALAAARLRQAQQPVRIASARPNTASNAGPFVLS